MKAEPKLQLNPNTWFKISEPWKGGERKNPWASARRWGIQGCGSWRHLPRNNFIPWVFGGGSNVYFLCTGCYKTPNVNNKQYPILFYWLQLLTINNNHSCEAVLCLTLVLCPKHSDHIVVHVKWSILAEWCWNTTVLVLCWYGGWRPYLSRWCFCLIPIILYKWPYMITPSSFTCNLPHRKLHNRTTAQYTHTPHTEFLLRFKAIIWRFTCSIRCVAICLFHLWCSNAASCSRSTDRRGFSIFISSERKVKEMIWSTMSLTLVNQG